MVDGSSRHQTGPIAGRLNQSNRGALSTMPDKQTLPNLAGPMPTQQVDPGSFATLMLPIMPGCQSKVEIESSAPEKKQRTRAEAVRAALARITRRKSLRKQRDAQKS